MANASDDHDARWGDVFEIAVKRGLLYFLRHRELLSVDHPQLAPWRALRVGAIARHLVRDMALTDQLVIQRVEAYTQHLLVLGYGLGWTVIRSWLQAIDTGQRRPPQLVRLWCPLALPARGVLRDQAHTTRDDDLAAFWAAFGLDGTPDPAWQQRGRPANADGWLEVIDGRDRRQLLCLEFSLNVSPELDDFCEPAAHLAELERTVRAVERRGVFARLRADLAGTDVLLSDGIISHIQALTSRDKPLYKLCQGASYVTEYRRLMANRNAAVGPLQAQVLAVTATGIEGLSAYFGDPGQTPSPQARLMVRLGRVYRDQQTPQDTTAAQLDREIRGVFRHLARALPAALRRGLSERLAEPPIRRTLAARFSEPVTDFVNPVARYPRDQALGWIEEDTALADWFGRPAREALAAALPAPDAETITLRDLHYAAVVAGLRAAAPGRCTVLALEGHPGIGKTYALTRAVRALDGGFLFFYTSPRVVINTEVSSAFADEGSLVSLTTNARLTRGAAGWWRAQPAATDRRVDSAVVGHYPPAFCAPETSILYVTPEQAAEIEEQYASAGFRQTWVDDRVVEIDDSRLPGVMRTLGKAFRDVVEANPTLDRYVLTAAVQGYRQSAGARSTIKALAGEWFRHRPGTEKGLRERERLAERLPNIIVMIDEVAGDGAGAPLVQALAWLLREQFVLPFTDAGLSSPYRVVLVIADASLANPQVLASYLSASESVPEKVLIGPSRGGPQHRGRGTDSGRSDIETPADECLDNYPARKATPTGSPFGLAVQPVPLGAWTAEALHIMADSFPASTLQIDYAIRLTPLRPADRHGERPGAMIREQAGAVLLRSAVEEITRSVATLPAGQQVIFFAQDKPFLYELETTLCDRERLAALGIDTQMTPPLDPAAVGKLDSSVPTRRRQALLHDANGQRLRVILMTSSGARGVSFPRAAVIIAMVPRFAIEAGLMEIAQLVYRGRGGDGDRLARRLVLLLDDFVFPDGNDQIDTRQWLRQTIDLISMLVLLRATLLTRIRGDAGIPRQSLAVVPVGSIGADETLQTLSQTIQRFLAEAELCRRDQAVARTAKAHATAAHKLALSVLAQHRWQGQLGPEQTASITVPETMRRVNRRITQASMPLVADRTAFPLPAAVFCTGALWFEDWRDVIAVEQIDIEGWDQALERAYRKLLGNLREITKASVAQSLKQTARDLLAVLARDDAQLSVAQTTRKALRATQPWVVLPVDYPRFCPDPEALAEKADTWRLDAQDDWLTSLAAASALYRTPSAVHPVIPRYAHQPFVTIAVNSDPLPYRRALDNRCFMASTEFNLLSTLLFVDE